MNTKNIGRNDPCPCGSGKKYKQCCQHQDTNNIAAKNRLLESIPELLKRADAAKEKGDFDTSEKIYLDILKIMPKHTTTLNRIALLKADQNLLEDSLNYLQKALKYEPCNEVHANLGIIYIRLKRNEDAIRHLNIALAMNPGDYISHNNLGFLYCELNNFKDGLPHLYKSTLLNPSYYLSFYNLGVFLLKQGKYNEAAQYYQKAIEITPKSYQPRQNHLFCLCFNKSITANEYLKAAKSLEQMLCKDVIPFDTTSIQAPAQKLRVGFVSGDLRNHVVSLFLENILVNLKKDNSLELFAYSTTDPQDDEVADRLKTYFKQWCSIAQMTAKQAAELIFQDKIHILIDLNGHTANSGLSTFVYKPAPLQITWLGYWASTGFSCMDYFLADPIGLPTNQHHYFSEKICYLPKTRLCFTPPSSEIAPEVNQLPALINGYITFGCFQNLSKVNDNMLAIWSKILHANPSSKMMFKNAQMKDALIKLELIERFESYGVDASQLILEGSSTRTEYFYSYYKVDFMLDTFPYPGGTTTCEALWMGVPTLTLSGNTVLERQGHSMMHNANLDNWICQNEEEYIEKAIQFTLQLDYLSDLRNKLREQVKQSPLMDSVKFAADFKTALIEMWGHKFN
ncbi:MAG: tetratricopeptide repeat protein [Moraxellaceae bacterium]|nr:tetratricopeptide repeat protein [Moraxellaceae bacterium]